MKLKWTETAIKLATVLRMVGYSDERIAMEISGFSGVKVTAEDVNKILS